MHLKRLSLDGFGCLRSVSWSLPPTGFILLGPNESGKSTLAAAVEALLFGQQPREARSWQPWEGWEFAGEVELVGEDGRLLIRRSFADNRTTATRFDSDGNIIDQPLGPVRLAPGGSTPERALYGNWLSAAIGMDSADLFRRTLYIPQGQLEIDMADIDGLLRSYLTGGGLDVAAVSRQLAERRRSVAKLSNEGRANPGELDKVRLELEAVWKELSQAREREGRLSELRSSLADLEATLERQQGELDRLEEFLKTTDRAEHLRETSAHIEELLQRDTRDEQRDAERRSQVAALSRRLEEERYLIDTGEAVRRALSEWEHHRDTVTDARERLVNVTVSGQADPGPRRRLLVAAVVGALVGVVLGVLILPWPNGLIGAAVGLVLGIVPTWWFTIQRPRLTEQMLRRRDLYSAEEGLTRAIETLGQLVPDVEPAAFGQLGQRLEELENLARRKEELAAALLTEEEIEELKARREARSAELESVREELGSLQEVLAEAGLAAAEVEGVREKRQLLAREVEAGQRRLQALREEAAMLRGAEATPVAVLEERREELEEREDELAGRFRGLRLAEEVWAEALRVFQDTYLDRYAERVGTWLKELSGSRYGRVRLHGVAEAPEAELVPARRWVPVDRLSQGARDRLYFALRLALAEVMGEQGVNGPLILDDPFVNFDAQRLMDVFEVLKAVARRRQVILLVHDGRYRALGWPVEELSMPAAKPADGKEK